MSIPSVLEKIVATKHEEVRKRRAAVSMEALPKREDSTRGFRSALAAKLAEGHPAVIAEIKKASPSKGVIRADFDPVAIATSYERGSAACLSCLTDEHYFQGHDEYLKAARQATQLPVLRKDFVIDAYQVAEAYALGADCVLLIAAILDPSALADLYVQAQEMGLDVLIEVHDEKECEQALSLAPPLLGINNRDLHDFSVSLQTTLDLLPSIPPGTLLVTESGIQTTKDVRTMQSAGVNAFLIGEAFMREPLPGRALEALFYDSLKG